jgi:hypothetical protein
MLLACTLAAVQLAGCAADTAKQDAAAASKAAPAATTATTATTATNATNGAGAATAASAAKPASGNAAATAPARNGMDRKLSDAVVAPLADLNLVRTPIPAILAVAQTAPYALPTDTACAALGQEIAALDAVLDPDLDVAANAIEPTLMERGGNAASDAMIGAVRSTTEGVIPFRGWVRKLTGAERYARELAAAIGAGTVRRAYLKGLGQAGGCVPPAAPHPAATQPAVPKPEPTKPAAAEPHQTSLN